MNIRPITIEFTGPPNSGKTTLIHNLAKSLQEKGFSVKVMQEDNLLPDWLFIIDVSVEESIKRRYADSKKVKLSCLTFFNIIPTVFTHIINVFLCYPT